MTKIVMVLFACDFENCGEESCIEPFASDARAAAKADGWKLGPLSDLCPKHAKADLPVGEPKL